MKTNGKHDVVARIARRGVVFTGILALGLASVGIARAQSSGPSADVPAPKSVPATNMKLAPTQGTRLTSAPANASVAPAVKPPAKAAKEGIKVHGHWTIEVRNPDGMLARHVEFENALCPTIPGTNGGGTVFGGDIVIAGLLAGTLVTGGWEVQLGSPALPTGSNPVPACGEIGGVPSEVFILEQSNDGVSPSSCPLVNTNNCFKSLNPPTMNSLNVITLAGQFTVPQGASNTQITAVGTAVNTCGASTGTAACLISTNPSPIQLTGAYLTGVAPLPAAVTVSASQSVAVTVALSFQ